MTDREPDTIARLSHAIHDFDAACAALGVARHLSGPRDPDADPPDGPEEVRHHAAFRELLQAIHARCDFAAEVAVRRDRAAREGG